MQIVTINIAMKFITKITRHLIYSLNYEINKMMLKLNEVNTPIITNALAITPKIPFPAISLGDN